MKKAAQRHRPAAAKKAAPTAKKSSTVTGVAAQRIAAATAAGRVRETPLIVPAPVGTFVLHVIRGSDNKVEILMHVCPFFERYSNAIVAQSIVSIREGVLEAAVLHPTGHVSGSPMSPFTFENVEAYRLHLTNRYYAKPAETKSETAPASAPKKGSKADGKRAMRKLGSADPEEDLIG